MVIHLSVRHQEVRCGRDIRRYRWLDFVMMLDSSAGEVKVNTEQSTRAVRGRHR